MRKWLLSNDLKEVKEFVQQTSGRSEWEEPARSLQVGVGLAWVRNRKEARGLELSN